jgi:flavin-dependent dehydrogenase
MDRCDAIIVGGGPGGSSCARRLVTAGLDVVVIDRAAFPRDKVCAGWITPQVVRDLGLDLGDYRRGRTLQEVRGFEVGTIGSGSLVSADYDRPVSYGIRRCEFDEYLLRRSAARLRLGTPVASLTRDGRRGTWIVNGAIEAPVVVGAGGHFCPVARLMNGARRGGRLVVAQEVEARVDDARGPVAGPLAARSDSARLSSGIEPGRPALFMASDFQGYGWCFRKGGYLNVGLGRVGPEGLAPASREFSRFLRARGLVGDGLDAARWRGHAYLLSEPAARRVVGDGVLLVGDAAGLAYARSGEGIRPAIESGLLAADAILGAEGRYTSERLMAYETRLAERFNRRPPAPGSDAPVGPLARRLLTTLLGQAWFVRRVVLDRWFLRASEPGLVDTALVSTSVRDAQSRAAAAAGR